MYFPDLSLYSYANDRKYSNPNLTLLNVGWLDNKHEYPKGVPSEAFLERLWIFCCSPMHQTMGYHECMLCENPPTVFKAQRNQKVLRLGASEIRVIGNNKTWYAAPDLIYHYVSDHHYCPPEEFVQAVLHGPLPNSEEYWALINSESTKLQNRSKGYRRMIERSFEWFRRKIK